VSAGSERVAETLDIFLIECPNQLTSLVVIIGPIAATIPAPANLGDPAWKRYTQPLENRREATDDFL
jgi:hypothetical protein